MLGKLRERYQRMMMPMGRKLAKTGITPNAITILSLLVALLSACFFYLGELLIGLGLMVLAIVMDMFDGAVARAANMISKFGATLDHTLDRYAEFLFILGLMMGPAGAVSIPWWPLEPGDRFVPWFWGVFALFGMVMASFTRAKAESVGGMKSCAVGIAERQEKMMLIIAGVLLIALPPANVWMYLLGFLPNTVAQVFVSIEVTNILTLVMVIVGILSHVTVVQRLAYARKVIRASEQGNPPLG